MSTRIYITESLKINNVNEETSKFAEVVKSYIEQINGMIGLRDLNICRLRLSVDNERVEIEDVKCSEPGNCSVSGDRFADLNKMTHCVISKDHNLFRLLDKLTEEKDISLEMEYEILHDAYTSVYGSDFFDLYLKDMHMMLSDYVTYKCCMLNEESEYEDNLRIYRFDETYCGEVPFLRGVLNDAAERNWSICNFVFSVGVENETEKIDAEAILKESFSEYGFNNICSDEDCVWIETNCFLKNYRLCDFIAGLNKAKENISHIDSEVVTFLSAFSTDDDYIAARIYTENGMIVTDWCF